MLLYQFLIAPLQVLFEYIFGLSNGLLNHYGFSILVLSLCMNLLLLPLYRRSDAIQAEERETERRLAPVVDHLKKTFRGDERFMMLSAWYAENNYKPWYVLKGFLSLALEVPFFIAAYNFLSNYQPFQGASFGPIADLGAPDRLLSLFGTPVNLLPILMTVINLVSGAVYTKGGSLKEKLPLWGSAAIFLVLLYDSPSALVLYWTMNNLFSLVKNLLTAGKKPESKPAAPSRLLYSRKGFLLSGVFLALLTGVLIPSAVIVSSPAEFVNTARFASPLRHVLYSFLLSAGVFVLWFGVFGRLSGEKGKARLSLALWVLAVAGLVNYMAFVPGWGLLTPELRYIRDPVYAAPALALNLAVFLAVGALAVFLYIKKPKVVLPVLSVLTLAVSGLSAVNLVKIHAAAPDLQRIVSEAAEKSPSVPLSKKGKNVILLMMDRAIDSYFPYYLEEKPQLKEQFAGFTWYPETLSFGPNTLFTAASLYGGYEYRPSEMNKRTEEPMEVKHNEALRVLPVLFSRAGYEVTVCDPPLAGFQWIPDLSIYEEYPEIRAFHVEQGSFAPTVQENQENIWRRNFFCYGLSRCVPTVLHPVVYGGGTYYAPLRETHQFDKSWAALHALPDITQVSEGEGNTFLAMCNDATHDILQLSEPEYEHITPFDNTEYDRAHPSRSAEGLPDILLETDMQKAHYQSNLSAMLQIGRWLETLRQEGVYDNTRIIIAADHGYCLGQYPEAIFDPSREQGDATMYNPLFLFKDFGETELKRDDTFMTNADAPAMLLQGLIENPVNPFTGKPITNAAKGKEDLLVTTSPDWQFAYNNGPAFFPAVWYRVTGPVLQKESWQIAGEW